MPAPSYCRNPYLSQIVLKACAFRPQDRFQSPKEMRKALEALLEGKPLPNQPAQNQNTIPPTIPPQQMPVHQTTQQYGTQQPIQNPAASNYRPPQNSVNSVNPAYNFSGSGDNTSTTRPNLPQNNSQPATQQPQNSGGSKKPIIIAAAAIAVVALAVVLILVLTRKPSSKSTPANITEITEAQSEVASAEISQPEASTVLSGTETSPVRSESETENSSGTVSSDAQYFQNINYTNWESDDAITDIQNRGWKVTTEPVYGSYPKYNRVASNSVDVDKKTVKLVVNNGYEPFEVTNVEAGIILEDEKIVMMEGDTITTHITFTTETLSNCLFELKWDSANTDITTIWEGWTDGNKATLLITGNSPCEGNIRVYLCNADTNERVTYRDFYLEVRDKNGAMG